MSPIQIILLLALSILLFIVFVKGQLGFLNKAMALMVFIASAVVIIMPDLSNEVASSVGVGRGADLIFYLGFVIFLFFHLILFRKHQHLKQSLVTITREHALLRAEWEKLKTDEGNSINHESNLISKD